MIAILDSGPLIAAANPGDPWHRHCAALLNDERFEFVVPVLCLGEAAFLVERALGPLAEARFITSVRRLTIASPVDEDWPRIVELMERYADWPLGLVDASVVALAERLERRHSRQS